MRVKPDQFIARLGVQWLCAAMDCLLGERSLKESPALLSGYASLLGHPQIQSFARAAFNLRQFGVDITSDAALRHAVHDAVCWEDENRGEPGYAEPPYELNPDHADLPFRLRSGHDRNARHMADTLLEQFPWLHWNIKTADPSHPMWAMSGLQEDAIRLAVDMSDLSPLPHAPRHDLTRRSSGRIVIPLSDLVAVAEEMDKLDVAVPARPRGNWKDRLINDSGGFRFEVLGPESGKLQPQKDITLEGVKHLIGLPGTGKTTLIILILVWLSRNNYQTVVLLPSIEASLNMLADLRFYGADPGLLMGQSPETRLGHARRMSERIAAADDANGYGKSSPGADLMGLGCAAAGFVMEDPGEALLFPHMSPPCTNFRQNNIKRDGTPGATEGRRLCPVGSACGRMKAARDLTAQKIWIGHILSTDTSISPHFSEQRLRYIEAIAATADVVILDEADGAQAVLDRKSIASLDLTGSEESYDHILNRDLFMPVTAGRNDLISPTVQSYGHDALDFRKLNDSIVRLLHQDFRQYLGEGPLMRFQDILVTSGAILTELFGRDGFDEMTEDEQNAEANRNMMIRAFWDSSIKAAIFRRTRDPDEDADDIDYDLDRVCKSVGRTKAEVEDAGQKLSDLARTWISESLPARRESAMAAISGTAFGLIEPRQSLAPGDREQILRFLVCTTTVIVQFLRLVPAQQAMVAEGIHRSSIFDDGVSTDFGRLIPENLVGRLSGVRFRFTTNEKKQHSVRLQYVSFRGVPRAVLYRLNGLLHHGGIRTGPAVLLASATSFLHESPTFHIPIGPDFVLRRPGSDRAWTESEFIFAPIRDPARPDKFLRFSGAGLDNRRKVLRQMTDHFFKGDNPLAFEFTRDFDAGRKVAFVVNSYEQVREIKRHLEQRHPSASGRVIGVTDHVPAGSEGDWVTASQVERLSLREDWDCLVFPLKSIARGVNLVFERGVRAKDALIGTIIFLTRPHPAAESLDLAAGLASRASMEFDRMTFHPAASVPDMLAIWRQKRLSILNELKELLRFPLQASRLGSLAVPFTADIMVDILQAIGRGMRNGCKVRAVFVDAAWAPRSAHQMPDTVRTSMIVIMRSILQKRVSDPSPIAREIYTALYEPFLRPLEQCRGMYYPEDASQ